MAEVQQCPVGQMSVFHVTERVQADDGYGRSVLVPSDGYWECVPETTAHKLIAKTLNGVKSFGSLIMSSVFKSADESSTTETTAK